MGVSAVVWGQVKPLYITLSTCPYQGQGGGWEDWLKTCSALVLATNRYTALTFIIANLKVKSVIFGPHFLTVK